MDDLERALADARERGDRWLEKFRAMPDEEKAKVLAPKLFETLFGGEMEAPTFDSLPEKREPYGEPGQDTYVEAVAMIIRFLRR